MLDATVSPVDRGTVTSDVDTILEGFVRGTADEPNPETIIGDGRHVALAVVATNGSRRRRQWTPTYASRTYSLSWNSADVPDSSISPVSISESRSA